MGAHHGIRSKPGVGGKRQQQRLVVGEHAEYRLEDFRRLRIGAPNRARAKKSAEVAA